MKKTVSASTLPVSVKVRQGYDHEHINVIELAHMAEDAGIASITIHGRTREQQYGGTANWELIAMVKDSVKIPVCGNGDIFTAAQAFEKQKQSCTDSIMIGRGAMGNPWIFRNIKRYGKAPDSEKVTNEEKRDMIFRHYQMMLEDKPEPIAVREMRKHIGWYIKGMKGAAAFRTCINQCADAKTVFFMIKSFFDKLTEPEE